MRQSIRLAGLAVTGMWLLPSCARPTAGVAHNLKDTPTGAPSLSPAENTNDVIAKNTATGPNDRRLLRPKDLTDLSWRSVGPARR